MVSRDAAEGPDRRATKRETVRLGRVVVIGGGCYGSWYAQQLTKAAEHLGVELAPLAGSESLFAIDEA